MNFSYHFKIDLQVEWKVTCYSAFFLFSFLVKIIVKKLEFQKRELHLNYIYIYVLFSPVIHIYIYIYIYIILNKSWPQHPTRHQLYGHLPPNTKTIQVRWTRHAGHCWRRRDELISDVLLWTPHMTVQKQDDQYEHTFSNYMRIQDVVQKTCLRRWTIGKSGKRGSGISVLPARHDDDDIYLYIYVYQMI